jgi:thiol-disulfide isomerase/thioredoxin
MSRPQVFSSRSFSEALAVSKDSHKLLLLDATASWCEPCKVMDRSTWVNVDVVKWLNEQAIAIQIDVDQDKDLAARLGIRGMPTLIAFRDGAEFDRVVGMKRPGELIAWLEDIQRGQTSTAKLREACRSNETDMRARYALARALASCGRFAEATDDYAWLWEHVLEHEPAMVGVRGSFMLTEIAQLIQHYSPARAQFARLRDALSSEGIASTPTEVGDWIALSLTLGDTALVLDWFDRNIGLLATRPELEHVLRIRIVPLLMERDRWSDISRLFGDPMATLGRSRDRLDDAKRREMPEELAAMRPKMIEALDRAMREEASVMVASLLAAGRTSEAVTVAAELRRLSQGPETERALLDTTKRAGVTLP